MTFGHKWDKTAAFAFLQNLKKWKKNCVLHNSNKFEERVYFIFKYLICLPKLVCVTKYLIVVTKQQLLGAWFTVKSGTKILLGLNLTI